MAAKSNISLSYKTGDVVRLKITTMPEHGPRSFVVAPAPNGQVERADHVWLFHFVDHQARYNLVPSCALAKVAAR